jgi:hypothetical protein
MAQTGTDYGLIAWVALFATLVSCGGNSQRGEDGESAAMTGGSGNAGSGGSTGNAGSAGSAACPVERPNLGVCEEAGLRCDYVDEHGCPRPMRCGYLETTFPIWINASYDLEGPCESVGTVCAYSTPIASDSKLTEYTCGEDSTWQQLRCPEAIPEPGAACSSEAFEATGHDALLCRYNLGCSNGMRRWGVAQCGKCYLDQPCTFSVTEVEVEDERCR